MTYEEKSAIVIEQLRADRDRLLNVLDEIRTEIERLKLHKAKYITNDYEVCIDSQAVLDIIDKYREGGAE